VRGGAALVPTALVIDAVYFAQTLGALLVLPRGRPLVSADAAAGAPVRRATQETLPAIRLVFRVATTATQSASPLVRHVAAALARAAGESAFEAAA
jgi:hypothetical protein